MKTKKTQVMRYRVSSRLSPSTLRELIELQQRLMWARRERGKR